MIHLDTHVLVWLYAGEHERFPANVRRRLESEALAISPMVELELTYLHEVGRLRASARELLDEVAPALELQTAVTPFAAVVRAAAESTWTRDPFDRLIVAQASVEGAALLTADQTIRQHAQHAAWD